MSMTFFESSSQMEQKKSTQKRNQLLNAALDVFPSMDLVEMASLDEIAQLANMHKSNIFYYYENKESVCWVLTTVIQKWLEKPLQILEVELEPTEALTHYLMQKSKVQKISQSFSFICIENHSRCTTYFTDFKKVH